MGWRGVLGDLGTLGSLPPPESILDPLMFGGWMGWRVYSSLDRCVLIGWWWADSLRLAVRGREQMPGRGGK